MCLFCLRRSSHWNWKPSVGLHFSGVHPTQSVLEHCPSWPYEVHQPIVSIGWFKPFNNGIGYLKYSSLHSEREQPQELREMLTLPCHFKTRWRNEKQNKPGNLPLTEETRPLSQSAWMSLIFWDMFVFVFVLGPTVCLLCLQSFKMIQKSEVLLTF